MKKLFLIIIVLFPSLLKGQKIDTLFYDLDKIVCCIDSAYSMRIVKHNSNNNKYEFKEYDLFEFIHGDFKLIQEGELLSVVPEIKDGKFKYVDILGNTVVSIYSKNKFQEIIEYKKPNGKRIEPIYINEVVDTPAKPEGGWRLFLKTLKKQLKLKRKNRHSNDCARILIQFTVSIKGKASNIKLKSKLEKELDQQLIEIVPKLKFKPAIHKGKKVKTIILYPMIIKLK